MGAPDGWGVLRVHRIGYDVLDFLLGSNTNDLAKDETLATRKMILKAAECCGRRPEISRANMALVIVRTIGTRVPSTGIFLN